MRTTQFLLANCIFITCVFITQLSYAQSTDQLTGTDNTPENRQLRVLAPTLALEQIDRAVLNRLLQEITDDPDTTAARIGVENTQLQDIFIILSNAHGFINDNDIANVHAMCKAWDASTLDGTARVEEALDAYARRAQFTKDFIAKYYNIVLADIEAELSPVSLPMFRSYMEDRRRRMASAGAMMTGSIVQNSRSGAESIQFHCRSEPH